MTDPTYLANAFQVFKMRQKFKKIEIVHLLSVSLNLGVSLRRVRYIDIIFFENCREHPVRSRFVFTCHSDQVQYWYVTNKQYSIEPVVPVQYIPQHKITGKLLGLVLVIRYYYTSCTRTSNFKLHLLSSTPIYV